MPQLPQPRPQRAGAGAATAGATGGKKAKGTPPGQKAAAPTAADDAVHVTDRASAYFVIGIVAVFAAILLYALLFGNNGLVSDVLATPKPAATPIVTLAPTVEARRAAPSEEPSAAASAAPSAAPASAAPSEAPASAAPSEAPSAAPESPSPAAS